MMTSRDEEQKKKKQKLKWWIILIIIVVVVMALVAWRQRLRERLYTELVSQKIQSFKERNMGTEPNALSLSLMQLQAIGESRRYQPFILWPLI